MCRGIRCFCRKFTERIVNGEDWKMSRQASGVTITEQKFAEKLVILTERGNGILIRLYNIKKVG